MIIELFGPPGVGKTTLACEIATRLRERGRPSRLALSYRPAEASAPLHGRNRLHPRPPAALSRLARPLLEIVPRGGRSASVGEESRAAAELRRLLPPKSLFLSLRLGQYMLRLARSWHDAAASGDIVLFDQGFVQAVYTFALSARSAETALVGRALDAVPKPDLLVHLGAPMPVLAARLEERRRRQGSIERLCDRWTSLELLWVFERLDERLRAQGHRVVRIQSTNREVLETGAERIAAGAAAAADGAAA